MREEQTMVHLFYIVLTRFTRKYSNTEVSFCKVGLFYFLNTNGIDLITNYYLLQIAQNGAQAVDKGPVQPQGESSIVHIRGRFTRQLGLMPNSVLHA
jgi:hypothetical protein